MFCYQCEQTAKGTGCTVKGVCGKDETVATLQDLLIHALKGIAVYAHRAGELGAKDPEVDTFTVKATFSTLTNVNFDPERLEGLIYKAATMKAKAKVMYEAACFKAGKTPETLSGPAAWEPAKDREGLLAQGREVSVTSRKEKYGDDVAGLMELVTYGVKGVAAYADHAQILGKADDAVYGGIYAALDYLAGEPTVDGLLAMAMKVGEINYKAMELLDGANTGAFGHPVPTAVRVTPVKGKAILISGHDLHDLKALL